MITDLMFGLNTLANSYFEYHYYRSTIIAIPFYVIFFSAAYFAHRIFHRWMTNEDTKHN